MTDDEERRAFERAMISAGYHKPQRSPFTNTDGVYTHQRDADRFAGWMLARAADRDLLGLYLEYYEADRAYSALCDEVSPGLTSQTDELNRRFFEAAERCSNALDAITRMQKDIDND